MKDTKDMKDAKAMKDMKKDFTEFFLMDSGDACRYAKEVLKFFPAGEDIESSEIGDGNINYVFRVRSKKSGKSVIIKQADRLLRSSGRPLDIYRNKIEARVLQIEGELAPGFVPEVYKYDEVMSATSMEDVSDYGNLRKELRENRIYPHLAENISTFMVDTLLPTTDLVLDRAEKKRRVQFFTNPELCDITEDLVLTEPYWDYKERNIVTPGNEDFVEEFLYCDEELHACVAGLRNGFMNNAQALLHGDLHSGSIFANEKGIKVLDPEFAFYGPMGYDIGNVIGNLFFSLASKVFTAPENDGAIAALEQTIADVFDMTLEKLYDKYEEHVEFPLYLAGGFQDAYIGGIMADSLGYAGTEIIRRTVGDSKVPELNEVTDPEIKIPMERALIKLGISLIKHRGEISGGNELVRLFRMIIA